MSLLPIAATGLAGLLGSLLGPPQPAPQPIRFPSSALVAAPAGTPRGTMIMVHGGGWQGPGAMAQKQLMTMPGDRLTERGWRVVSIDYHAGAPGLQDVLDAAGAELAAPTGGPLCIYGESSGAQLALVAASRLPEVDCVVAVGPPADFEAYQAEAQSSNDRNRRIIAEQMATVWGAEAAERAPNDPIKVAGSIAADVLMLREADDPLIPIEQVDDFVAARPTTQRVELESAPGSDLGGFFLHGTLSDSGRDEYRAAIGSFADRAVVAHAADLAAERTGCGGVTRSVTQGGTTRLQKALRCLARTDAPTRRMRAPRGGTTIRRVHGEVNAARAWRLLRASTSGRRALAALAAGHARTTVRSGDPTRVTLRMHR